MPTDEELDAMSADALLLEMESARRDTAAETKAAKSRGTHRLGRAAARLHDQHGMSWPQIGRRMGVNASTAWRWAEPHLQRD